MNMKYIGVLGLIASVVIIGIVFLGSVVSIHNEASLLKNQYDSKVLSNSGEFDNMWKKIKQSARVPESKKNAFKEIFSEYADSRNNGNENPVMNWITESVPSVDLNIYDELINIITGSRDTWTMKQTELVSIAEQHNMLLVKQPSGMILSMLGHEKINAIVITSDTTEAAFSSGKDNYIDL